MLQEGRTDAPIGRARFAGSLRGRLLLAALAVSAPLLLGAGLWILLLSHSAARLPAACERGGDRVRRQRPAAAASERGGGGRHQLHADGQHLALREFRDTAARVDRELADTGRYDEQAEIIAFVSIRHPWELAKAALREGR